MSQASLGLFAISLGSPPASFPLFDVARLLAQRLADGKSVDRAKLTAAMRDAFGAGDESGAWSMRNAYDVLETALVLRLCAPEFRVCRSSEPSAVFAALHALERSLPTQTYRSERQVAFQQFSTPLTLAWLAGRAAAMRSDDIVLEPSAGIGMLAAQAARVRARLLLNERDPQRAALLGQALEQPVTRHDAEHIADLLPGSRPSIVLINPPFSRSEARGIDRHAGARHLRSALQVLAPLGRCVAIMPPGFSDNGPSATAYAAVCEIAAPRVEILITGSPYAKHGTSIDVRLLVFDKGWSGQPQRHVAANLAEALPMILALPLRLASTDPRPPAAPIAAPIPRTLPRNDGAALLQGVAVRRLAAPVRSPAIDDSAKPLVYTVRDTVRPAAAPVGIYVPWRLARIDMDGADPHPDALVESVAMGSVSPPAPTYGPLLPDRARRALSDAQLETVILAGEAFERDLAGRFRANEAGDRLIEDEAGALYRTGFFIGDGTGVGKGREAAGCIMDQWCRGRRKAVWISKSAALIEDARRDWSALGGLPIDIQGLDAFPLGSPIAMPSGILFLTYATLRSQRHDDLSRLQQILAWLGPDHDGMIVFDEAHALANAAGTESDYGAARGSEQGLAGVRLQNALPRARILYVSATGATDPANLCYAVRLGLWGSGTAFGDRTAFMAAMEQGGIAAMEIVARDLKALGLYTARALSFAGVEYEPLEHRLTTEQIAIYDKYANAWGIIHRHLDDALKAANIVDRMSGDVLNAQARGAALSRFESAKQRFFSQLLVSMKMPTLLTAIERELAAGHLAVVQLVTTAEAILDRRLADLPAEERASLDIDLSPRETVVDYLRSAFPTRQMRAFRDSGGTMRSEMMVDDTGAPVHCQEAIAARDELIERLCAMPPMPAALDELIRHFGTDRVAEVTGRSRRVIVDSAGRQKIERRGGRANIAETDAFMDGRKTILAFSDAGGTGRSYHADLSARSAGCRRIHFLLEPGWRAAAAVQGLGRTHRTNQATPPVFRPVTTDCRGERRFISTIARRLDGLGALTRGQRQTGGQNLFDPADNLESDYAKEALVRWYHLLHAGKLTSVTLETFTDLTGLALTDKESGGLLDRLPPIQRWLNRILALRIATQNAIFEEYLGLVEARIDAAREAGALDVGVETIVAEKIVTIDEQLLRRDPLTGAETHLRRLELHRRRHPVSFQRLMSVWRGTAGTAFLINGRSGRAALCVPSWSVTDENGRVLAMCQLVRPTGRDRISATALSESYWTAVDEEAFRRSWDSEVAEASATLDIETISVATGLLLPVWHKLPADDVRVWRITDADGRSLLGRIVPASAIEKLAAEFGVAAQVALTAEEIISLAKAVGGAPLSGLGDARLTSVLVNGQRRLEIRGFPPERREWLKSLGCFTEIIAYKTRLFVPTERATAVIDGILRMA